MKLVKFNIFKYLKYVHTTLHNSQFIHLINKHER